MRARVIWMLGCMAALAPGLAKGQGYAEPGVTGPIGWNIGGTIAFPLGDSADRVNVAGGLAAGVTFNFARNFGAQLEYGADWSSLKTGQLQNVGIGGNALLQYFDLNLVFHPTRAGAIGFYLIGGGGLYYRGAEVTKAEGTIIQPYCDPWLYYCSAVPVPVESILGSRSSWDFGLDGGVGMTFAIAPPLRLYLEARYHYIFGPSYTAANGERRAADGQYLPLTLGLRF